MKITDKQREEIEAEFNAWKDKQYGENQNDKKSRQEFAQFFTPPALSMRMAEKFDTFAGKDILDPAAGAGGLLVVAIICGADPSRVYGIELDPRIAKICRQRLSKFGVLRHHIHVGNALDANSYAFEPCSKSYSLDLEKNGKILNAKLVVDCKQSSKETNLALSNSNGKLDKKNIETLHKVVSTLIEKELEASQKTNKTINVLNSLFNKLGLESI